MRRPEPRILAYAPGDRDGAGLVAAACRSGALGVLDLDRNFDPDRSRATIQWLAQRVGRDFSLRVRGSTLPEDWLAETPSNLNPIILVEEPGVDWSESLSRVHRSGRRGWVEVTSRRSAVAAAEAGAEGLILVGHEAGGLISEDSSFILLQAVLPRVNAPVWVRGGIGPHVAAGCVAAGAAGVVLDGALLLARESPLPDATRAGRPMGWERDLGRGSDERASHPGPRGAWFGLAGEASSRRLRWRRRVVGRDPGRGRLGARSGVASRPGRLTRGRSRQAIRHGGRNHPGGRVLHQSRA